MIKLIRNALTFLTSPSLLRCFFTVLYLTLGLSGCHTAKNGVMENPPQTAEAREKLLKATQQLMDLPEDADLKIRNKYRRIFEAALAEYLIATRAQTPLSLQFKRDGKTYSLPVQIISSNRTGNDVTADTVTIRGESIRAGFRGEILDMAWLPVQKGEKRLMLLFADSLVSFPWENPGEQMIDVYKFPREFIRPIRSAFPIGILSIRDLNNNSQPVIALLTSSLHQSINLGQKNASWQPIEALSTDLDLSLPSMWSIPSGKNEFRPAGKNMPLSAPYLSFRRLPGDKFMAAIDENGFLELLKTDPFERLWRSERPWGKRLFVLDSTRIAICDGQQNAFVVFQRFEKTLILVGESQPFRGKVNAIIQTERLTEPGYLVSINESDNLGMFKSRLVFVTHAEIDLQPTKKFAPPLFPDDYAELSFSEESTPLFAEFNQRTPATISQNVYECLFNMDERGAVVPLLAERIVADSTYRQWKITLREGIRFSDRSLLTANDVIQSWQKLWQNDLQSRTDLRWLWQDITGAKSFAARKSKKISGLQIADERTLRITLAESRPDFPEFLTQWCFRVAKPATGSQVSIGTGPFVIKKIDKTGVVCERNVFYHEGRPLLANIRFKWQQGSMADALLNNQRPVSLIRRRKDIAYFKRVYFRGVKSFPISATYFLALNPGSPSLQKRIDRLGVAGVLSRRVMADIITEATCRVAPTLVKTGKAFSAPKNMALNPGKPLRIIYRGDDGVAKQIADRLSVRLAQNNVPVENPRGVDNTDFRNIRLNKTYDILIDAFVPTLSSNLLNLLQLLNKGYALPGLTNADLNNILQAPAADAASVLENRLMRQGILYPIVRVQQFAAMPSEWRGIRLKGVSQIDFSKTWKPRPQ